jgi:ABC-type lipopolysaccharide export system ATPase subunit
VLFKHTPFHSRLPTQIEVDAIYRAATIKLPGRGMGVLFSEHDVRGSLDFCDRAYVMSDGHIATSGSASGLLAPQ